MTDKFANYFTLKNLENSFNSKVSKVSSKGIDKKSTENFKSDKANQLEVLERKIKSGTFKFSPYLEILRVKNRESLPRLLSLPTIRDRIILNITKDILHEEFKDSVNRELPNSYIRKIKKFLEKNKKAETIHFLKTDIKKFYDEVDRGILIKKLKKEVTDKSFLNLLKNAIETPTVPSNYKKSDLSKYIVEKGIPQGLSISNILAQIYLKEFDDYFRAELDSDLYLRYVDEIIIFSKSDCTKSLNSIKNKLAEIKLNINEEKTLSGNLEKQIEFLGYSINRDNISVSNKAIESQINKIAAKVTWFKKGISNPKARPGWMWNDEKAFKNAFINEVNAIITGSKSAKKNYGWLFWYIEIDDLSVFYKMDSIIESMFRTLKSFNGKPPKRLKKTVKAYFDIKYNKGGSYIKDYDKINTLSKKKKLLQDVAQVDPNKKYSDTEIFNKYENYRDRNLKNLERDIGYGY